MWFCQLKLSEYLIVNFSPGIEAIVVFLRIFLFFSILLALTSFGDKYWNNPSKIDKQLAANAYNIYLVHVIFILVIQLFFLNQGEVLILVKLGIVTLFSMLLSYLTSQYILRPFPRLSVAIMIALFALLTVFLNHSVS
jgi:hypothetical protein